MKESFPNPEITESPEWKRIVSDSREDDISAFALIAGRQVFGKGMSPNISIVTASTGITSANFMIDVDATLGVVIIDLPTTGITVGQIYNIAKSDASINAVTVDGDGNTINGAATLSIPTQYQSRMLQFNGTEWRIISGYL